MFVLILKRIISISLIFGIVLQSFSTVGIYLYFQANQKYIAENLCINKARPEMKCDGKCQLCKMLKKEESKEKQLPGSIKDKNGADLYCQEFTLLNFNPLETISSINNSYFQRQYIAPSGAIFHPPQFIA